MHELSKVFCRITLASASCWFLWIPSATAEHQPGSILWRWIGVKAESIQGCPLSDGDWVVEPLFGRHGSALPGLDRFCRYTYVGPTEVGLAEIAQITSLVPGGLSSVGSDAVAIGSQGWTDYRPELWMPLERHALDQAAKLMIDVSASEARTRLAVIDSTPTTEESAHTMVGRSRHGHTLLNFAHQLLCATAEPACGVHLTSRLALPYLTYDPANPLAAQQDPINGGYVGTISDLAFAIVDELEAWQQVEQDRRLVLNLSVGWNPTFGGLEADADDMPPPVRAVFDALNLASCKGALAVAAAGNRTGGPAPVYGPMLPAGWQERSAPDDAKCQELGAPFAAEENVDRPLLLAVAGVSSGGRPLTNARPGSAPPLAAYGDHVVVESHVVGQPTRILTGSSVATLVVSAAAAAVWQELPELSAAAVMDVIYESGETLGRYADVCWQSYPNDNCQWQVRRVSICPAVAKACENSWGGCLPPECAKWSQAAPDLSDSFQIQSPDAVVDLASITEQYADTSPCTPDRPLFDPVVGPADDPCPDQQYESVEATPWVHPQPGSVPCPPCRVQNSTQTLVMEIDPYFQGVLSSATLTACGTSYSLGPVSLSAGDVNIVENVNTGDCAQADISFTVENNGTTSSAFSPTMIVD